MDPMTAISAAYQGLNMALNCIDRLAAYRAAKKRERLQRLQGQQQFLHEFIYAAAPPAEEVETIRSYCRKVQNVIRTHWEFIFGRGRKGRKNAQAAHAVVAGTLFQVAAMPGLPTSSAAPSQNLVAGNFTVDVYGS